MTLKTTLGNSYIKWMPYKHKTSRKRSCEETLRCKRDALDKTSPYMSEVQESRKKENVANRFFHGHTDPE